MDSERNATMGENMSGTDNTSLATEQEEAPTALVAIVLLISAWIIVVNVGLIINLLVSRRSITNAVNLQILTLSVTDALIGVSIIPVTMSFFVQGSFPYYSSCAVTFTSVLCPQTAALFHMFGLCVHRVIAAYSNSAAPHRIHYCKLLAHIIIPWMGAILFIFVLFHEYGVYGINDGILPYCSLNMLFGGSYKHAMAFLMGTWLATQFGMILAYACSCIRLAIEYKHSDSGERTQESELTLELQRLKGAGNRLQLRPRGTLDVVSEGHPRDGNSSAPDNVGLAGNGSIIEPRSSTVQYNIGDVSDNLGLTCEQDNIDDSWLHDSVGCLSIPDERSCEGNTSCSNCLIKSRDVPGQSDLKSPDVHPLAPLRWCEDISHNIGLNGKHQNRNKTVDSASTRDRHVTIVGKSSTISDDGIEVAKKSDLGIGVSGMSVQWSGGGDAACLQTCMTLSQNPADTEWASQKAGTHHPDHIVTASAGPEYGWRASVVTLEGVQIHDSISENTRTCYNDELLSREQINTRKTIDKRQKSVLITIGILLVAMNVCISPFSCLMFIEAFDQYLLMSRKTKLLLAAIAFLNSALNPFIYATRIPRLRESLSRNWTRLRKCVCYSHRVAPT